MWSDVQNVNRLPLKVGVWDTTAVGNTHRNAGKENDAASDSVSYGGCGFGIVAPTQFGGRGPAGRLSCGHGADARVRAQCIHTRGSGLLRPHPPALCLNAADRRSAGE